MPEEIYYHSFLNRDRIVHIVDPDLQTCEAMSVLFRLEGFQTAFSINLPGFLASLERRRPDVVIANLDLNGDGEGDGISLLRRVKTLRMGTPVFMLENRPQVDAAVSAMKAGAADVVTKPIDNENLIRIVRDSLRQDIHVSAVAAGRRSVEVRGFAQLTPREREVLQLITNGQSNKEAGRELGISPRTIEVHRPASWKSSAPATPPTSCASCSRVDSLAGPRPQHARTGPHFGAPSAWGRRWQSSREIGSAVTRPIGRSCSLAAAGIRASRALLSRSALMRGAPHSGCSKTCCSTRPVVLSA